MIGQVMAGAQLFEILDLTAAARANQVNALNESPIGLSMSETKNSTIYVDADACPVKEEILRVAERQDLPVTFVANGGLRPSRDPMIRNVIVPKSADAADDWIAERAGPGDVVITQDIPLAARCVENGSHVLGNTGREHTRETIGMAVAMRDLKQHLRETGEDRGFNRAFTRDDRSVFLQALDRVCRHAKRQSEDADRKA